LYLTLQDAIALALENNLDLAIARYNMPIADTDLLRTKAGGSFRGVNTGVVQGTPGGGVGGYGAGAPGAGAGGTTGGAGGAGAGASGLVQSTLAEIPSLDANFRISAHRIATLLGKPAGSMVEEIAKGSNQPAFRADVNVGIPADIIRNRPDIRKAERDLADSTAQIGVAEAKLFPSITLSGSISPSGGINERGVYGNLTPWSFGPKLKLPILDGGGLRADVDSAKSKATVSYLKWKSRVLNAIEQVENALVAMQREGRTVRALKREVEIAQETLRLSTSSYKDGASSLLDLLEAQRSLSVAQASLATAIQQRAKHYVALNSAVGGGYNPVAKAPTASN
jgi:multidrug efflux system outer membrane protein